MAHRPYDPVMAALAVLVLTAPSAYLAVAPLPFPRTVCSSGPLDTVAAFDN